MNEPNDFDALKCSRQKKKQIAAMLAVWNLSMEAGRCVLPSVTYMNGATGDRAYIAAARKVGVMVKNIRWRGEKA